MTEPHNHNQADTAVSDWAWILTNPDVNHSQAEVPAAIEWEWLLRQEPNNHSQAGVAKSSGR
ncbi:hypothetical protein [Fodinicola feengrottensis]|nr:hypothetical protein [Fodinicola feengrottensis]